MLSAVQLLAIATYRSSEMLLSKHPFLPVALDLQARGVCQVLPLEFLTAEDVDQYLALEFPNHRFPGQFASLIHTKTEGNPLFMTDVVRYLRDKKVIGEHDGRWALVQTVPEIETDLPASVRSMIQRKIAQLGDADRRLLLAASAQGYTFDSAVVARALALDPGDVEERLQSLDQTHGFVSFREEEELPDHTLTLRYRFVHVLYQNALFETLTPSRRAALSAAVAAALLAFYGDDSADVASELAFLFQAARDWTQASDYFLKAARNAARIFANQEAVSLCQRGLDMNRRTRDAPQRARQELKLLMTLGPSLMTIKGFAATDTVRTFLRAQELCEQVGDGVQQFRVLFGLSIVSVVRAEYEKARYFADQSLQQAERAADGALLVQAHWALGLSLPVHRRLHGLARTPRAVARSVRPEASCRACLPVWRDSESHASRTRAVVSRLSGPGTGADLRRPPRRRTDAPSPGAVQRALDRDHPRGVSPQRGARDRHDGQDAVSRRRARIALLRRNRLNHARMGACDAGGDRRRVRADARRVGGAPDRRDRTATRVLSCVDGRGIRRRRTHG